MSSSKEIFALSDQIQTREHSNQSAVSSQREEDPLSEFVNRPAPNSGLGIQASKGGLFPKGSAFLKLDIIPERLQGETSFKDCLAGEANNSGSVNSQESDDRKPTQIASSPFAVPQTQQKVLSQQRVTGMFSNVPSHPPRQGQSNRLISPSSQILLPSQQHQSAAFTGLHNQANDQEDSLHQDLTESEQQRSFHLGFDHNQQHSQDEDQQQAGKEYEPRRVRAVLQHSELQMPNISALQKESSEPSQISKPLAQSTNVQAQLLSQPLFVATSQQNPPVSRANKQQPPRSQGGSLLSPSNLVPPSTQPETNPPNCLSRQSLSIFADSQIKEKNETYIDNRLILKAILEANQYPLDLSRRQIQRIIHNFSTYEPSQEKETEFDQLKSDSVVFGLETFESHPQRLLFRRIFQAVVLSVKQFYNCNSMAAIEILRMYISSNRNNATEQQFPWNRIKEITETASHQMSDWCEVNTSALSFQTFVKEIGSLIKIQKIVLVHIFQNLKIRQSLLELLRRSVPKIVSNLWQSLKSNLTGCSDAVSNRNLMLEQVYRINIELILKSFSSVVTSHHNKITDEVVCEYIREIGRIIVEVPHLEEQVFEIMVKILQLDDAVEKLHRVRMAEKKLLPFQKRPELLISLKDSDIPMLREIAPAIETAIGLRSAKPERSQIIKVKGAFWIDWMELWLHQRELAFESDVQQAGSILVNVLEESAAVFWSQFNSLHFTNIKRLITRLYRNLSVHFELVVKILTVLAGNLADRHVKEVVSNMGVLLTGDQSRQTPFRNLYNMSNNVASYNQLLTMLICRIAILEPKYLNVIERSLETDIYAHLLNCLSSIGKSMQTYVEILRAINRLLLEKSTMQSIVDLMVVSNPQSLRRHPCFQFLNLTIEPVRSESVVDAQINIISALNDHLSIVLNLHSDHRIGSFVEQRSNWLATVMDILSQNRIISLRDIYILLMHVSIDSEICLNLILGSLSKVTQQDLFRYLLAADPNIYFSNLYTNSILAAFVSQQRKNEELVNLIYSLKIILESLRLMGDEHRLIYKPQLFTIIKNALLQNTTSTNSMMTGSVLSKKPHLLVIIANLIAIEKSSLYMLENLHYDDISGLALKIINRVLMLGKSNQPNRLNRVLFDGPDFKRDVILYGTSLSLKALLLTAIKNNLKQSYLESYKETLVLLVLIIRSEPTLTKDIYHSLQLSIETALLRSLQVKQPELFSVVMISLVAISSTPELSPLFRRLFLTSFFVDGLIKKCIGIFMDASRCQPMISADAQATSIFGNLCVLLSRELEVPNNQTVQQTISSNLALLMSPGIVKNLFRTPGYNFGLQRAPKSKLISWISDRTVLQSNFIQLTGNIRSKQIQINSIVYESWCKLCLTILTSDIKDRDSIARALEKYQPIISSTVLQINSQLKDGKIAYVQPAIALLAVAVGSQSNVSLATSLCKTMKQLLNHAQVNCLSFNTKLLLLTMLKTLRQVTNDLQSRLRYLLENDTNIQLLLFQNNSTEDQLRLLLRCIGSSKENERQKFILPMRHIIDRIASQQSGWNSEYIFGLSSFIKQYAFSSIPMYDLKGRSSMHICWCWTLMLAREIAISPESPSRAIDCIQTSISYRLNHIVQQCQTQQYIDGLLVQKNSLAALEELTLLLSSLLALYVCGYAQTTPSTVGLRLCSIVSDVGSFVRPFSGYQQTLSTMFGDRVGIQQVTNGYGMLQFYSDITFAELLEYYLNFTLLSASQSPIGMDSLSNEELRKFQTSTLTLLQAVTTISYRFISNKESIILLLSVTDSKQFKRLSKETGYLSSIRQKYQYGQLIDMMHQLIVNTMQLISLYVNRQIVKTSIYEGDVERLTLYCKHISSTIRAVNCRSMGIFGSDIIEKMARDIENILNRQTYR